MTTTQTMYTSWIMMAVPILIYATAAALVEFCKFTRGEIVAILSSFASARTNVIALCAMRSEAKVAVDLVGDLA